MKILYAVQATGNGHISRAREIVPHLHPYGEVDVLISGRQADVSLPYLIKYKKKGLSYTFGKRGGIDWVDTVKHLHPLQLARDIYTFPVEQYDMIINDFEPVTAWACKVKQKPCVALSHQAAYLSPKTPRPSKQDKAAEWMFKNYAPSTQHYGFHFKSFDEHIFTPVIRNEIRELEPTNNGHITVYLPAHADTLLIKYFEKIKTIRWEIFSKHTKRAYTHNNISVLPVNNDGFIKSMAASGGLITAGGFESVAEAIYLHKPVLVIPMSNQYEQQCNAVAAQQIGVTVLKHIGSDFINEVRAWLHYSHAPQVRFPDITSSIIEQVVRAHGFNRGL